MLVRPAPSQACSFRRNFPFRGTVAYGGRAMAKFGETYERGNRLIDALSSDERADVVPALELIHLKAAVVTHAPTAPYDWVVFPIDAVLSVVAALADGDTAEVGTVGNEGASGVEIAFGAPVLRTTICQVDGRVARMRTTAFLDAIDRNAGRSEE